MPEGLATADGERVSLEAAELEKSEREFAAAMAAPGTDDPEFPAPPDIGTDPEAPFGRRVDGSPKKGRGGRPPKEPSRTTTQKALPGPQKPGKDQGQAPAGKDYSQALADFTEVIWLGLAGLPIPGDERRVRCRVQAAVLKANQPGLVSGVNIIAQHNGVVRWGVEHLVGGDSAWIFPAALALMPFAVQTAMLWKAPVNGDMAVMAAKAEEEFSAVFASILKEMGLAEDEQDESAAALCARRATTPGRLRFRGAARSAIT
jgi:hypothetical protein